MDIRRYLARIGYIGEARPTREVLFKLQESHLLSVPFENLDIHAKIRISLDENVLFDKIVLRQRGGFCYELNGLFHLLLRQIGYDAKLLMGRVYDHDGNSYGFEFDHMLILAEVDGVKWLVDVGFGDFSFHPLEFTLDQPLSDRNGRFAIERYDDEYFRVSRYRPEENRVSPEYLFSLQSRTLADFVGMCNYHQTSPDSHFTRQKVCSMATATGRVTLTDHKLIVAEGGVKKVTIISDEFEFAAALARYFEIVL